MKEGKQTVNVIIVGLSPDSASTYRCLVSHILQNTVAPRHGAQLIYQVSWF